MADAVKRSITVKEVQPKPWNMPDSNKWYYTVVVEEHPSEPIKFIQDRDKGAPEPEVGKKYDGNVYADPKGDKFYPFIPKQAGHAGGGRGSYAKSPEDRDSIYRCNALTNAVVYATGNDVNRPGDTVLKIADAFYAWLKQEQPKADAGDSPPVDELGNADPLSNEDLNVPDGWL